MHIPDSFLNHTTIAATAALAAAGLGAAVLHAQRNTPQRHVPLMGISAAFVFAAQLINFPVVGGASGHLTGSVLCAVLLGPSPAVIVMSAVLIVQALLYGDGGVTALGANILNMGLIGVVLGYGIFRGIGCVVPGHFGRIFAVSVACWATSVIAAICCAGEIAASGHVRWNTIVPAMAGWYMLIGLGEAIITVLVLSAVTQARPELLQRRDHSPTRGGYWAMAGYGLIIAMALALFASPWSSELPDGLGRAASDTGIKEREQASTAAPMTDYKIPAIVSPGVSTAVAGGAGTVVVFAGSLVLAFAVTGRGRQAGSQADED